MSKSLAGQAPPAPTVDRVPPGSSRIRDRLVEGAAGAMLPMLPRIPDRIKRLMLGARSVTVDGNTLDTTLQMMLTAERLAGVGNLVASPEPEIARAQLRKTALQFAAHRPVDVDSLTIPGPVAPIRARHYWPLDGAAASALLVFYHGGGFVLGDLDTHDDLCRLICRDAGIHVLSIDYRLAPEHKAPAAVDDAYAAYRWARDYAAELGAEAARVAVGGDSAGGNLAAVVSQRARDDGMPLPALQLLIYPATHLGAETRSRTLFGDGYFLTKRDMDWFEALYLDGSAIERSDPLASPLRAENLGGLPPALVVTAGFDPLRDEGTHYAEAMRAAGVTVDLREYGSMVHGFASFSVLGGGSVTATADMISALRAHLSHG